MRLSTEVSTWPPSRFGMNGRQMLSHWAVAGSNSEGAETLSADDAGIDTSKRKLRVLMVDDNEDAVQSLEKLLSLLGYEVRAATNGKDALAIGSSLHPDIALLDLGMPEMDGYELARAIRQQAWGASTRLIALTGWGQPEDIRRSMMEGFEAHLVKPIKTFELLRIMGRSAP